jgi:hypothetical protein
MDVYLVPISATRYELYCEGPDLDDAVAEPAAGTGIMGRLRAVFRRVLAEAERHRRGEARAVDGTGWTARLKARALRWIADSIAEQRLLWQLRKQSQVRLVYPADLDEATATARLRAQLTRDLHKHRLWMVVDGIGFIASGLLALLPGPNLLAYYLGFRLFGHYMSHQGARRGLQVVCWTTEPSHELAELRAVVALDPAQRCHRVRDLASRLRLQHLERFVERTAPRAA